jgi:putative flippase GtrA
MQAKERTIQSPFKEWARFVATGAVNTGVDFAVLNTLLFVGRNNIHGVSYVFAKTISFLAAVLTSFFLNKYWVFRHKGTGKTSMKEGGAFFAVSAAGFLINVASSSYLFSALQGTHAFDPRIAANAAALTGTLLVLAWNYAGYKFFVFKPNKQP